MKSFSKKIKYVPLALVSVVTTLLVWGLIEPHTLNTEKEVATIPNLPKAWDGKVIGQISDLQIGMWGGNSGTVRRSVNKLIDIEPAAVLISGDFIYHATPNPEPEIEKAVSLVRPLVEAGIPTYAVLGNHDYGMSEKSASPETQLANDLEAQLKAAGVVVLDNESVEMQLPDSIVSDNKGFDSKASDRKRDRNKRLHLVAVDSRWADQDSVNEALSDVSSDDPRIALMHNPDTFEQFPPNSAPLAVAGHTHGGQMRIPGMSQWSWLRFTQKDEVHGDSWAVGYGKEGNNLYINVGIGMSIVPIRLFCPPELTLFTLTS